MEKINEFTLAKENGNLYTENQKLIAENIVLKRQIEKMKCCGNCIYRGNCELGGYKECKNFDKWELKE